MTLDRQFCQQQLARFSGLPGYPKADDGKRSMIDAMQGAFAFEGGDVALKEWVEDWLRTEHYAPQPVDVWAAASVVRPPPKAVRCEACDGTGWRYVERPSGTGVTRCNHAAR